MAPGMKKALYLAAALLALFPPHPAFCDGLANGPAHSDREIRAASQKLSVCFYHALAKGQKDAQAVLVCQEEAVTWCTISGVPTRPGDGQGSVFDNPSCATNVESAYRSSLEIFNTELDNYESFRDAGQEARYRPILFDIRIFLTDAQNPAAGTP